MKKIINILVCLSLLCSSSLVQAQDNSTSSMSFYQIPANTSYELKEDVWCYDYPTNAKILNEVLTLDEKYELSLKYELDKQTLEHERELSDLSIHLETVKKNTTTILLERDKQIQQLQENSYSNLEFAGITTAAMVLGLIVGVTVWEVSN